MKIHEFQAKEILAGYGIPIPREAVASTPEEAERIARELGGRTVIKAQVHVGGRGKAGGVKLADSPETARERASGIIGMQIKGRIVHKVLVAQAAEILQEFYLGVVLDRTGKSVTLMASAEGGVEIEEVAKATPDRIVRVSVDPFLSLADYQTRELGFGVGLAGPEVRGFSAVVRSLYRAFVESDASLLEINPLVLTKDKTWLALDAKMVIDDNALFRQPALAALRDLDEEEPAEVKAREAGLSYVKLSGNIGCIVNGAGLAMATMDSIKLYGGEPANFLDIGGGAKVEEVTAALRIVLSDASVRAVLINIFGGITRCDVVAQGLVAGFAEVKPTVPVIVRLVGTNEAEGREMLKSASVERAASMSEAAQLAVQLSGEARP